MSSMKLIDLYYKSFHAFREHTINHALSERQRKIISASNEKDDRLKSIKYTCHIEDDWISNIEEGLIYVEKAILEDRQFIFNEGNVVPIEKAKRTSKSTVEHLSRHSEYITRIPADKNATLIPDKLYIVEKLNDYTVYENRFLYMLLCYLKDFIQLRLDRIKDQVTTYQAFITINKEIKTNDRIVNYKLDYSLANKNDDYLIGLYKDIPNVSRIENIEALVESFLLTPLMKEVSKAPMIKAPIIKTNVLLMNQNFRVAVDLYEYVSAYNQDGYTFEEIKKESNPFTLEMSDEVSDIIELTSTISYIYGNDIKPIIQKRLEIEKERQKELDEEKALESLKRLKKMMIELNEDPVVYINKLEQRLNELEKDSLKHRLEKETNEVLRQTLETKEKEIFSLYKTHENNQLTIDQLNTSILELKQTYLETLKTVEATHQNEMDHLAKMHETIIKDIKLNHEVELENINREKAVLNEQINELKTNIITLNKSNEETKIKLETEIEELGKQLINLKEEKDYSKAQYDAVKAQHGLLSKEDNYTSKEKFNQLEQEMKAYQKFYKIQWKETKLKIKQRVKKETFNKNIENEQIDKNNKP